MGEARRAQRAAGRASDAVRRASKADRMASEAAARAKEPNREARGSRGGEKERNRKKWERFLICGGTIGHPIKTKETIQQ